MYLVGCEFTGWAFEKGEVNIFGWAKNYKIGVLLMENGK